MQMMQLIFEILKCAILVFCVSVHVCNAWEFLKETQDTPIYYGFLAIEFLIFIILFII